MAGTTEGFPGGIASSGAAAPEDRSNRPRATDARDPGVAVAHRDTSGGDHHYRRWTLSKALPIVASSRALRWYARLREGPLASSRSTRVFCSSESWDSAICRPASRCRFSVRGITSNLTPSHLPNAVPSSTCRPPASWPSIGRTPPGRSEPRSRAPAHGGGRGRNPSCSLFLSIIQSRAAATKRRQKRTGGQREKPPKSRKEGHDTPAEARRVVSRGQRRKGEVRNRKAGERSICVHSIRLYYADCFSPTKRSRSCAPSTLVDTLTDYHL